MASLVKFSFAYNNLSVTEKYWHRSADDLATVKADGEALLALRVMCLGHGVDLIGAYASKEGVFRDVALLKRPTRKTGGVWNAALGNGDVSDVAGVAFRARCSSGNSRASKNIFINFPPDLYTLSNDSLNIDGNLQRPMNMFFGELKKKWAWYGVDDPDPAQVKSVSSATPKDVNGTPVLEIITPTALAAAAGDTVVIQGVKYTGGQNPNKRTWKVFSISTNTVQVAPFTNNAFIFNSGGTIYKKAYKMWQIDDIQLTALKAYSKGNSLLRVRSRSRR